MAGIVQYNDWLEEEVSVMWTWEPALLVPLEACSHRGSGWGVSVFVLHVAHHPKMLQLRITHSQFSPFLWVKHAGSAWLRPPPCLSQAAVKGWAGASSEASAGAGPCPDSVVTGRSLLFGGCWPEAATFLTTWTFPWDSSQRAAGVVSGGSEGAGRGGERMSPALGRDLPSLRHALCREQVQGPAHTHGK